MTGRDNTNLDAHVDSTLLEILGYVPSADEDLTESIDSIQRLEFIIALEEKVGTSFGADDFSGTWWSNRNEILSQVSSLIARSVTTEST